MNLHTGGAYGADLNWLLEAQKNNIPVTVHSFPGHSRRLPDDLTGVSVIEHGQESLEEARKVTEIAAKRLGKYLQLRNYHVVKDASWVFAIGFIQDGGILVSGGTGWAVEVAKLLHKKILVFDQNSNWWYYWKQDQNKFVPCRGKNPPEDFLKRLGVESIAGIGSRDISKKGIEAIKNIFA